MSHKFRNSISCSKKPLADLTHTLTSEPGKAEV